MDGRAIGEWHKNGVLVGAGAKLDEGPGARAGNAEIVARDLVANGQAAQARDKLRVGLDLIARDRAALPALAARLDKLVEEVDGLRNFQGLIEQARAAESTSLGYSPTRGAFLVKGLDSFGVFKQSDWVSPLEKGSLLKQVKDVRRTAYEELLWLANHTVSWWHDPRSSRPNAIEVDAGAAAAYIRRSREVAAKRALAYLRTAEQAQSPSHWFYRLRGGCRGVLGQEQDAKKDKELADREPPSTVNDYYLQALVAAKQGNVDSALQSVKVQSYMGKPS